MANYEVTYQYTSRSMRGVSTVQSWETVTTSNKKLAAQRLVNRANEYALEDFKIISVIKYACTYCRDTGVGRDGMACC